MVDVDKVVAAVIVDVDVSADDDDEVVNCELPAGVVADVVVDVAVVVAEVWLAPLLVDEDDVGAVVPGGKTTVLLAVVALTFVTSLLLFSSWRFVDVLATC